MQNSHQVVIAGAGPTGLMLAGELALAGIDVILVERRPDQELVGWRAGGLHARTIEVLDQRGIADRFLAEGKIAQVAGFAWTPLDISDFPTRHNYGLALWQGWRVFPNALPKMFAAEGWLHAKLTLVALLLAYFVIAGRWLKGVERSKGWA